MKTLQILVIDGDPADRKAALRDVERLGHRVTEASCGEEAIDGFKPGRYQAILVDAFLENGFDIYAITSEIRHLEAVSNSDFRPVQLIALTSDLQADTPHRCFAAGMNDLLKKPLLFKELERALARVVTFYDPLPNHLNHWDEPLLDPKRLEEIRAMAPPDEPSPLPAILELFLNETPPLLRRFNEAVLIGNKESTFLLSRQLQGSCQNFGARRVSKLCAGIEEALKRNASPKGLLLLLNEEFTRMVSRLHHLRIEG